METEASKLILDDVEDFGVGRSYWTLLILDADDIGRCRGLWRWKVILDPAHIGG